MTDQILNHFPTQTWHPRKATLKAQKVRLALVAGFQGALSSEVAEKVAMLIGPDEIGNDIVVCIPFRARNGEMLTLYGGHIHAVKWITWDILCLRDGDCVEYEDDRYEAGLQCLRTKELVRVLRNL